MTAWMLRSVLGYLSIGVYMHVYKCLNLCCEWIYLHLCVYT